MACTITRNISTAEEAEGLLNSDTEWLFIMFVMPCVMVIGILGNGAFLVAVARIPRMRTITNLYLAQVAACDAFFITIATCSYLWNFSASPLRFHAEFGSWFGCCASFFPIILAYMASLFLLTLVTAERFYAICYPFKLRAIASRKRNIQILTFTWIVSIIFAIYGVLRYSSLEVHCLIWPSDEQPYSSYPESLTMCLSIHPTVTVTSEIALTLPFYIVLPFNLYMYARIIYTLGNRMQSSDEPADKMSTDQSKVRNQVARLLIINGLSVFACQSPARLGDLHYITLNLTGVEIFSPTVYGSLVIIGRTLLFLNSMINPFIYIGCSPFYRRAIWEAVTTWKVKESRLVDSSQSTVQTDYHEDRA